MARREWGPWTHTLTNVGGDADAALDQAVAYLQTGLPAEASRLLGPICPMAGTIAVFSAFV